MADKNQQLIEDAVKSLKGVQETVKKSKIELLEKIAITRELNKVMSFIDKLQAIPLHERAQTNRIVVSDVDAPRDESSMTHLEKTAARTLSDQIDTVIEQWMAICETLGAGIRSNDRAVIGVSTPPKDSKQVKNTFNNNEGEMVLVVSTSSQAYAITRDKNDTNTISAAKYWKPIK